MNRERFEDLVARAIEELPDDIQATMENVDVVVADVPDKYQLEKTELESGKMLLGLYEGVPLTERPYDYGMVVPDKITIFQQPIESICTTDDEIIAEVIEVVWHEIAHHFGIDDETLEEFERQRKDKSSG